jgi:CheY-like chemotaxis protein
MVRTIVSRMLESVGYKVITANNGRLGYDAYLEHREALVGCVVDVTMPELDGYSLVRHMQNHSTEIPIVMVSGYHIRDFEDRDIDRTNVTFLQKPFEVEQLLTALDTTDIDIAANQIPPR